MPEMNERALAVDLDGTLTKGDMMMEAAAGVHFRGNDN